MDSAAGPYKNAILPEGLSAFRIIELPPLYLRHRRLRSHGFNLHSVKFRKVAKLTHAM